MTALEILRDLERLGVQAIPEGDRLRIVPKGVLTPELRERVLACKPELLAILKENPSSPRDPASPWPPALPGLGPWTTGPFTDCLLCGPGRWEDHYPQVKMPDGTGQDEMRPVIGDGPLPMWTGHGTWARFGGLPLCLHHARGWTETRSTADGARQMLHALLDVWAGMDEARWTQAEVGALYNQIISFWSDWPAAESWWEAWRAAHPDARLA